MLIMRRCLVSTLQARNDKHMKYSNLISKKRQYKYSANLCFDLRNEGKLTDFIPTLTTIEILREYLGGIINCTSETHSRILYGSYGTGKSHLLTVCSAILGHINTQGSSFKQINDRIAKYDKELAHTLSKFVSEDKPYLVVPVYSDYADFGKCISYSLKKELERNNIEVCFKGYFDEALQLVDKWSSGETSSIKVAEECKKMNVEIKDLIEGLRTYDVRFENIFSQIYEGMSYGAPFNSSAGNLLDNMNSANQAVKERFKGIVLVFDEFGRYVEDFGEEIKVKAIQDLAEYCDHCDNSNFLILVSHKQLSLYLDIMKKSISDEWKKVEGRFKTTSINIKYDQCLSLIGNIIPKTERWTEFKNKFEKDLNDLYNQAWDFKGFLLPPEADSENPFEDGFPLHPIALYALDRLSKKVAQNERTFFTYLAGDEEYSLFNQLESIDDAEFHIIGLDAIFDYFELNIKTYKADASYAIFKKLQCAINKLGAEQRPLLLKVLKVMAVIYIIADSDVIVADRNTIANVIDEGNVNVYAAIDILEQQKIIKFMRQYGCYDFFDSSIFDLEGMIEEKIVGITDEMVTSTLNYTFSEFLIYPYQYNEKYHMNRVFQPIFASHAELDKKAFRNSLPRFYDGLVLFVLGGQEQDDNYGDVPPRSILLVNGNAKAIEREVKRFIGIQYYFSKKDELAKDDPTVVSELKLYLNEQHAIVEDMVRRWRSLDDKDIFAVSSGVRKIISSEKELSDEASRIMQSCFGKTIIVNNDLLNKNEPTAVIKKARKKVLGNLCNKKDVYDNCPILSPEFNIIRSTLSKNGIYKDATIPENQLNRFENGQITGEPVMLAIARFLSGAEDGKKPLSELYQTLKEEPYGLRDGYISILLAYALQDYENVSLYFHGKEHDYTAEELVLALEKTEDYSLYICNWSNEEKEYIHSLEIMFDSFLSRDGIQNRLKNLFRAINAHYSSISKSARTTDIYVSDVTKHYRNILSLSYNDYNKFFFETLPQINKDLNELVIQIANAKEELEMVCQKQFALAERVIRKRLSIDDTTNLVEGVRKLYSDIWHEKSVRAFDYTTNSFLDYVAHAYNISNEEFVKDVVKLFTGFEMEYWTDSKIHDFEELFTETIQKLYSYVPTLDLAAGEMKITIDSGAHDQVVSQFSKTDLSLNGQILLNKLKSTVDNFGESISYDEKISIMAQILKEIIS